jgi:hypothetical protein
MPTPPEITDPLQSLLTAARTGNGKLPPVHLWNPEHCGAMDLVIKRDGSWWHEKQRITRQRLTRLFSTILRKDDDGVHYLVTPVEKIAIEVEVAPFVATRVDTIGSGRSQSLVFTASFDQIVEAGPDHPLTISFDPETGEPTPLIRVRDRLDALLTRPVFYELAELAVEERGEMGVWSHGVFYPLGDGDG